MSIYQARFRSLVIKLALAAFGLLISLIIVEAALRVANYSAPMFRRADRELGWTLYPGIEGFHRLEQKNYLSINSHGFNNDEITGSKPEHLRRIAIVGDSFVEAGEVPRAENFVSQLQLLMNRRQPVAARSETEVLNFGVVGYGTAQELLMLRRSVLKLKPDLVILTFYSGNDVSDNSPEIAQSLRDLRPYFSLKNGNLTPLPGLPDRSALFKNSAIIEAVNSFRLLQLAKEFSLRRHMLFASDDKSASGRSVAPTDNTYKPPPDRAWEEAWNVTEALIAQFAAEVRTSNSDFLLLTIPDPVAAHPDRAVRAGITTQLGIDDFSYPESRLSKLAAGEGFAVLHTRSALKQQAQDTGEYLFGFNSHNLGLGHFNERGHRFLAELLMRHLLKSDGASAR